jgi:hypothetical protein
MVLFDLDPLTNIIARYWGFFRRNQHFVHGPIFAQNFGVNNHDIVRAGEGHAHTEYPIL